MNADNITASQAIKENVTAIVLSGGEGKRVEGRDKGLISLNNIPLVKRAIDTFSPHVSHLIISANRNKELYSRYGYPVVADQTPLYQGPLAGIAACLEHTKTLYAFVIACDMPLLPGDVVQRLYVNLAPRQASIAVAYDGSRLQPLCMLMRTELKPALTQAVKCHKLKVLRWVNSQNMIEVDCSDIHHAFQNLNSLNELESVVLTSHKNKPA